MKTYRQILEEGLVKKASPWPSYFPTGPLYRPYSLQEAAELSSGNSNFWPQMLRHLKANRQQAQKIFQPESLNRAYKQFDPSYRPLVEPIQNWKGSRAALGQQNGKPQQAVAMRYPMKMSPADYRRLMAFRSTMGAMHPDLNIRNTTSNSRQLLQQAKKSFQLPVDRQLLLNGVLGHQYLHVGASSAQKYLNQFIREAGRKAKATFLPQTLPQVPLKPQQMNYTADTFGLQNDKLLDPYITDRDQAVQAALSANQGRNLVAQTIRQHPWAYPKLSPMTKFYMAYQMPSRFSNKQQADNFYRMVAMQPQLFDAMPLQAKRYYGNKYSLQNPRMLSSEATVKQHQQDKGYGISPEIRRNMRRKTKDYYDNLWLLSQNKPNINMQEPTNTANA